MAGSKGRTGGAEGRVGGRLSAGSRAQKRLAKAPRVKVVGALSGLVLYQRWRLRAGVLYQR